jgi:hypothetical protein
MRVSKRFLPRRRRAQNSGSEWSPATPGGGGVTVSWISIVPLSVVYPPALPLEKEDNGVKLAHPLTSLRYVQGERGEKLEINYRSC